MSQHLIDLIDAPAASSRSVAAAAARPPFAWVAPGHPWHGVVEGLRAAIAAAPPPPPGARVQAELKGVRQADGTWHLERAYWSVQSRDARRPLGLAADTLSVDRRDPAAPRAEWLRLPDDPYLAAVPGWLAEAPPDARVEILRYVPLRRLTFRLRGVDGATLIGKFKRRSRQAQAYALLGAVSAGVARLPGAPGFVVAAPRATVPARALYFQSALAGDDLAERVRADDAARWLAALGRRQQRLQGVEAEGLPLQGPAVQRAQARSDLAWIAWFRPDLAAALRPLAAAVEAMPAWRDDEAAFCHGDLVASQCLVPPGGPDDPTPWGLTDFDLCHRGDPCRDLAILMASLDEDLALLADDAAPPALDTEALAEAILRGHCEEAARAGRPRPAPARLQWQRLCAELYYLGLMLKKDRWRPALFERRLARALRLAGVREGA